jgi:protoporphyrin/coproporphyrin ferrochelatase
VLGENRVGIILINLGTPATAQVGDVRRYLREFLSDPRVIDIAPLARWLLLNFVILPFRPSKSAAAYQSIWSEKGSPLLYHSQNLAKACQKELGDKYVVRLGMRYGEPSIGQALTQLLEHRVERIVALPLFPQYSSAATGSAIEKLMQEASKLWDIVPITIMGDFYDHPGFIGSVAKITKTHIDSFQPDYLLMSYHGLPERHVLKSHRAQISECDLRGACPLPGENNRYCYRAQCYATSEALAQALSLSLNDYSVSFQSRLGRTPWIKPYTDEILVQLAERGVKRLSVVCPSFVADCLETLEEISIRAKHDFVKAGGEDLQLVPCVNSTDEWSEQLCKMLIEHIGPS